MVDAIVILHAAHCVVVYCSSMLFYVYIHQFGVVESPQLRINPENCTKFD